MELKNGLLNNTNIQLYRFEYNKYQMIILIATWISSLKNWLNDKSKLECLFLPRVISTSSLGEDTTLVITLDFGMSKEKLVCINTQKIELIKLKDYFKYCSLYWILDFRIDWLEQNFVKH